MTSDIAATPGAPPAATAPPSEPSRGPVARLIGALFAPNATFADIARRPDILVPLLVVLFFSILGTVAVVPKLDFEAAIRDSLEQQKNQMSADDMERMVPIMVASGKVFAYASPLIGLGVLALIAAVLLLAFRVMGGEGTFKQAFSVTLYSQMPMVVKGIIITVVALMREGIAADEMANLIRSNPAFLVDAKRQTVLYSLLSSLDIFTVWTLILCVIGFAFVSKFSKAKSAAIVISLWIVTVIVKLGFAALGASRMKQA